MALGDLDKIERAFAEAALDSSLWGHAMEVAAAETDSHGATLLPVMTGGAAPAVPATESVRRASEHYFRDGWHLRDQRNVAVPMMMRSGVADDGDCIDPDGIARHPYYQEFLAPHGLRWFAGVRVACGEEVWCLSIQRTIAQGPMPAGDKLRLGALSRSLGTSAALARALGACAVAGALNAFEMSETAVALVNRHGEVYRVNRAAEALLGGDVRIAGRRIVCRDPAAAAALAGALHGLMWNRGGAAMAPAVALPRVGRSPLLAYPARLSAVAANVLAECQAIVVLVDPDERRSAPEALLHSGFSLTPTEARLASRLATGASLEAISDEMGISKLTGRTHLKRIFAKLGIGRQSELVALLAAIVRFSPTDR